MGGGFKHSITGKRNKNDFYPTHHSMVWQLMDNINIPEKFHIHDPGCGKNDIINALREAGVKNKITGKDISSGDDFLLEKEKYDVIFTNPPFSIANVFIEKSFQVARETVIMLLPLDYLHGSDRYNIFYKEQKYFYLSEVHIFVRRPMFTDSVNKYGTYSTGSVTFAWFVWEKIKTFSMSPIIKWIDNSKYVKGSSKGLKKEQPELCF